MQVLRLQTLSLAQSLSFTHATQTCISVLQIPLLQSLVFKQGPPQGLHAAIALPLQ